MGWLNSRWHRRKQRAEWGGGVWGGCVHWNLRAVSTTFKDRPRVAKTPSGVNGCLNFCCEAVAGAGQVAVWCAQADVVRWLLAVLVWRCSQGAVLMILMCSCRLAEVLWRAQSSQGAVVISHAIWGLCWHLCWRIFLHAACFQVTSHYLLWLRWLQRRKAAWWQWHSANFKFEELDSVFLGSRRRALRKCMS